MSDAMVIIRVEHPGNVAGHIRDQGVDARVFNDVSVAVSLDLERGDRTVKTKSGSVEVVQDAMVARVSNGEIVEIRD